MTVFFGNFGQSFFISWYGASLQTELGLSASAYGTAYSAATLVSGLTIMAIGGLIDRVSVRLFATAVACGLMLAALLMWQVSSLPSLVIALFLLRFCGQGLLPHTAITTMGRYFSLNRGKAISLAVNGVPLGEMLLPSLIVLIIAWVGWQQSWLVIAGLIAVVYLPLAHWLLSRAGPSEVEREGLEKRLRREDQPDGSRRTVLQDGRFWRALPLLLTPGFVVTGVFIHQGFILPEKGWTPALFATAFIVYGAVHWLGGLVTGALVDRYSAVRLMPLLGGPFVLGLIAAGLLNGVWVVYLMMSCFAIGMGMTGTLMNALWAEAYGTTHLGAIRSLITAFGVVSTALSPILLGVMIDAGLSVAALLFAMAGLALAGSVLARFSYRSGRL
ncbi:MAG: MFS transporter [Saccharospirillum sp.]